MSDFANRLRGLRLKYYWNQGQLARRAGVSTSLISSYEKSERFPSVDMLIKLSDIFVVQPIIFSDWNTICNSVSTGFQTNNSNSLSILSLN